MRAILISLAAASLALLGACATAPVTPRATLAWQIDPDSMVYTTAAKGYRIGGANESLAGNVSCQGDLANLGISDVPQTYNSDSVWSYELGSKSRLLNNHHPRVGRCVVDKILNLRHLSRSSAQNPFAGRDHRDPPRIVALVNGNTNRLVRGIGVLHQLQLSVLFLGEARLHVLHLFRHLHQLGRVADAPAHQLLLTCAQPRAVRFALVVGLAHSG